MRNDTVDLRTYRPGIADVKDDILSDPRTTFAYARGTPRRRVIRPYVGQPASPWPDISSVDRDFVTWKALFAKEATRAFPKDIDEKGFSRSGVTRDFSAMMSCPGVKMSRANAPFVDRTKVFADLGLATGFKTKRHERIFDAVHDAMFSRRIEETAYHFSTVSSTSPPFFEYSPVIKQTMIRFLLENLEEVLRLVEQDDLHALRSKFGIVVLTHLVERHQAEGGKWDEKLKRFVGKERLVNTPEHGLSGGRRGQRVVASKENITRDLLGLDNAFAMRVRTAYALNAALSYLISCFLVGYRAHYFEEFAYTWHHTTAEQIGAKLAGAEEVVGLDVTTMDQLMPKFLLDRHADKLAEKWDPRIVKLIRWINGCPYFAPQLAEGEAPFFAGDPSDVSTFNVDVGLSSGRPDNPDLGKWYMTAVYFCMMDDYFGDLLEQAPGESDLASISKVLKGEHPAFGLLDMGDDAVVILRKGYGHVAQKLREQLKATGATKKAGLSPYALLDLEEGVAFLGNVLVVDALGNLRTPIPNPVTAVVNRHCAEHGWGTAHRQYAGFGYIAAIQHYARAGSIITDLLKLQDDTWRSVMPDRPVPRAMAEADMKRNPLPSSAALTFIDTEVLLDPSKRFYKYSMEDISPEIRSLFSAAVEGDFIEKHISKYIR